MSDFNQWLQLYESKDNANQQLAIQLLDSLSYDDFNLAIATIVKSQLDILRLSYRYHIDDRNAYNKGDKKRYKYFSNVHIDIRLNNDITYDRNYDVIEVIGFVSIDIKNFGLIISKDVINVNPHENYSLCNFKIKRYNNEIK